MTASNTAAIVLAAGLGTRMNSDVPKALPPIAGRAMIGHVLDQLEALLKRLTAIDRTVQENHTPK